MLVCRRKPGRVDAVSRNVLNAPDAASTPTYNTMAYSQKIIDDVAKTPKSLGNQLGRWAIHLDFPVTKIARALGVSRQTVYNWFTGTEVFVAYRNRVEFLTKIMQTSRDADTAWRRICQEYNLEP